MNTESDLGMYGWHFSALKASAEPMTDNTLYIIVFKVSNLGFKAVLKV